MVDWLGWAGLALGGLSYIQNKEAAEEAAETANRLTTTQESVQQEALGLAREQYADVKATNALLRQLAEKVLGEASLYDDPAMREGFERLAGMHLATISGQDPVSYGIYDPRFINIDRATEIEKREVRNRYRGEKQRILDALPRGPARISLMAELDRRAADDENKVVAGAIRRKEDLSNRIRQQALTDAQGFFKMTPEQRAGFVRQAANIVAGAPRPSTGEFLSAAGVTSGALDAAVKQLEGAKASTTALGELAGRYVTAKYTKPSPGITYRTTNIYEAPREVNPALRGDYIADDFDRDRRVSLYEHP